MAKKTPKEWATIALYLGGAIAIYLVGRKVLQTFNVVQTPEEKKQTQAFEKTLSKAITTIGVKPTKDDLFWKTASDTIYDSWATTNFFGASSNTIRLLKTPQNDADVLKLYQFYGKRQNYSFGLPVGEPRTLPEAANYELGSDVNQINKDWASKGIKYRL